MFETIVSTRAPVGISVDEVNNYLYWTDTGDVGKIMRCKTDGSDVTVILNETQPTAITLDIHNRFVLFVALKMFERFKYVYPFIELH